MPPYSDNRMPRIGPGRGYAANFTNATTTTLRGAATFEKGSTHLVPVHLKPGWNLIGTPARNNIVWNTSTIKVRYQNPDGTEYIQSLGTAASLNWTVNYAVRNDNSVVSNGAQIVPGEGYLFYAYVECQLLFPTN